MYQDDFTESRRTSQGTEGLYKDRKDLTEAEGLHKDLTASKRTSQGSGEPHRCQWDLTQGAGLNKSEGPQ